MSEKSKEGGEKQNLIMLLVGLGLLFLVLGQGIPGFNGNGYNMMFSGFDIRSLISWLIGLIIKVLWILVWVGVIGGVYQLIKENWPHNAGFDLDWVAKCINGGGQKCPKCGMKVECNFKFCPCCQEELSHPQNANQTLDSAK